MPETSDGERYITQEDLNRLRRLVTQGIDPSHVLVGDLLADYDRWVERAMAHLRVVTP